MAKAIKLPDGYYWDSSSVSHNREELANIISPNIVDNGTKMGYKIKGKEVYQAIIEATTPSNMVGNHIEVDISKLDASMIYNITGISDGINTDPRVILSDAQGIVIANDFSSFELWFNNTSTDKYTCTFLITYVK